MEEYQDREALKTRTAKLWLRADGILYVQALPNVQQTLKDGQEMTAAHYKLIQGKPRPLLCDITKVRSMARDCRAHYASEEHAKTFSATALIIKSPVSKIIGNFFLGLNKPPKPTRLFTDEEMALEWLREYLNE